MERFFQLRTFAAAIKTFLGGNIMAVDKNLFLHDLTIVAIMKCEGPYLKEWLDYHLLAGVDQ